MTFARHRTAGSFRPGKSQFYTSDGCGRDAYICCNNGGLAPEKQATKVHPVGSFVV